MKKSIKIGLISSLITLSASVIYSVIITNQSVIKKDYHTRKLVNYLNYYNNSNSGKLNIIRDNIISQLEKRNYVFTAQECNLNKDMPSQFLNKSAEEVGCILYNPLSYIYLKASNYTPLNKNQLSGIIDDYSNINGSLTLSIYIYTKFGSISLPKIRIVGFYNIHRFINDFQSTNKSKQLKVPSIWQWNIANVAKNDYNWHDWYAIEYCLIQTFNFYLEKYKFYEWETSGKGAIIPPFTSSSGNYNNQFLWNNYYNNIWGGFGTKNSQIYIPNHSWYKYGLYDFEVNFKVWLPKTHEWIEFKNVRIFWQNTTIDNEIEKIVNYYLQVIGIESSVASIIADI